MKRSTIDDTGALTENKIFDDKSKVLLADYPFIVSEDSLLAFFEDKITGQTGLIKVRL